MIRLLSLSVAASIAALCTLQAGYAEDAAKTSNKAENGKTLEKATVKDATKSAAPKTNKKASVCKANKKKSANEKSTTAAAKPERFSELDSNRKDRSAPGGEFMNDLHTIPFTGRALPNH